jgi:hypothetical protein
MQSTPPDLAILDDLSPRKRRRLLRFVEKRGGLNSPAGRFRLALWIARRDGCSTEVAVVKLLAQIRDAGGDVEASQQAAVAACHKLGIEPTYVEDNNYWAGVDLLEPVVPKRREWLADRALYLSTHLRPAHASQHRAPRTARTVRPAGRRHSTSSSSSRGDPDSDSDAPARGRHHDLHLDARGRR